MIEQQEEVRPLEGLPPRGRAILVALGRRALSKEGLLRAAWGIEPYRPHRHDSVIKTTVSRLRTSLGHDHLWLETMEGGYRLADGIEVVIHSFELATTPRSLEEVAALAEGEPGRSDPRVARGEDARLARWGRIARSLAGGDEAAVGELARDLRTPVRTVSRDLAQMLHRGLIERTGEGRATRYRARHAVPRKEKKR